MGYSVTPGGEPWNDHLTYVSWQMTTQPGVTQSLSVNIVPTVTTPVYERVRAVASLTTTEDAYGPASASLWLKVGTLLDPGAVSTSRPAQGDISTGSPLTLYSDDGGGHLTPLDVDPIGPDALPVDEPFEIGFKYNSEPQSNAPVTAQLSIKNTVAETVSYTGTLTLPAEWLLLDGEASFGGGLSPNQTTVRQFVVLPSSLAPTWQTDVAVFPGGVAPYHDYHRGSDELMAVGNRGQLAPCAGAGRA